VLFHPVLAAVNLILVIVILKKTALTKKTGQARATLFAKIKTSSATSNLNLCVDEEG